MFTGIITHQGAVRRLERQGGDVRIFVQSEILAAEFVIGASVAHDGACLTIVSAEPEGEGAIHACDVSNETLSKTTLGGWREGSTVNLERAARFGDEIGGHLVTGHVDGVGELVERSEDARSLRLVFEAPEALSPMIAPKGSITINGVSLTVNEVEGARFGVNLIPHTADVTNLGSLQVGARVNLEIDTVARYLARLLEARG